MNDQKIAFIGAGNMAFSLISGLLADGYPKSLLCASDVDPEARQRLSDTLGIRVHEANEAVVAEARTVVLAVKPQTMQSVLEPLGEVLRGNAPLLLSIAAGLSCASISAWAGGCPAVVRAMPNTPAMVQCGASGLFATEAVSAGQRAQAESILRAVGVTVWVDREPLIDAVTALSGSGPAYFFLLMEAMTDAGVSMGLDPETAALLTQQTALGAGRMAMESSVAPAELRQRVTSPGGTTEQALMVFESYDFRAIVHKAMTAARDRAERLSGTRGTPS